MYVKWLDWLQVPQGIFSHSPAGKESACNSGDPGSIPGSGRSLGEEIGYPLQYSWAFHVAQLVKNSPAMQETWVLSLGWEDPLEKEKATHSNILAWRIPCMEVYGILYYVWSMGWQRVAHYWATFIFGCSISLLFCPIPSLYSFPLSSHILVGTSPATL